MNSHPTLVGTCFHFHQFQHSSIWLGFFGDMSSHPRLCQPHKIRVMDQPHKIFVIKFHLLGHTLLVSQLVTSITWYLYHRFFVCHGYGSSTNSHFIEVHLLGHTLSCIIVGHKHYKVSLFLDLRSSQLWVNHTKPFSSVALHIQQKFLRRKHCNGDHCFLKREKWFEWKLESTHGIHWPMVFIHLWNISMVL